MFKKLTAMALILMLLLCSGCSKKEEKKPEEPAPAAPSNETPEPEKTADALNPLTGVTETAGISKLRPVAVMINNDVRAQNAQAGLPEADIIYETEIEGGETRLMAVFQDLEKVKNIGTVRSARVPFIDLAQGHKAVYIHRGGDPGTVIPYLKQFNSIDIYENHYGERLKNGLALEHTLYTHGPELWQGITKEFNSTLEGVQPWQSFAAENKSVQLAGGIANKVTVAFSGNFKSVFVYDAKTGVYERHFKDRVPTEYFTKETTKLKNVVVCLANIYTHSNGEHRMIPWGSGEGYYFTNGTYQAIKWSKTDSKSPLKFTNADGTPLEMNAGNSWVCFASAKYSKPIIEK